MKQIESLYIQHKQDVYGYLLSLTHDPALAEDLLSETFVQAISSIRNFNGQSSIKTWLFSIARHLWLRKIKKEKRTVEYSDLLQLYVSESVESRFLTKEMVNKFSTLLSQKDGRTQKIVKMRVEGYSYCEIAQELNISESSARVIDYRTKKWIKTMMEKEGFN